MMRGCGQVRRRLPQSALDDLREEDHGSKINTLPIYVIAEHLKYKYGTTLQILAGVP